MCPKEQVQKNFPPLSHQIQTATHHSVLSFAKIFSTQGWCIVQEIDEFKIIKYENFKWTYQVIVVCKFQLLQKRIKGVHLKKPLNRTSFLNF